MKQLHDYLFAPRITIQCHTHQKNWTLWWILLAIGTIITSIQWSSVTLLSFGVVILGHVSFLLIMAIMVDASAQLLNQPGQLTPTLYWLGFAQSVLWLVPSATLIQSVVPIIGSFILLGLHGVYIGYIFVTIRQLYGVSNKRTIMILIAPIIGILIVGIVSGLLIVHQVISTGLI